MNNTRQDNTHSHTKHLNSQYTYVIFFSYTAVMIFKIDTEIAVFLNTKPHQNHNLQTIDFMYCCQSIDT